MYTILGAGLSGLSVADHLQKKGIPFKLYEAKPHGGGHIHSEQIGAFTWDEGPHVSFTKSAYVKQYFADNCGQQFLEYPTNPSNYYKGNWIPHPAQSHLYAIPEPVRSACVNDLLEARKVPATPSANYQEWLDYAFGHTFAGQFPEAYTDKYWTLSPRELSTDWIGQRVYFPDVEDVVMSMSGPIKKQTHYIDKVRYPKSGGFYSYIKTVEKSLPVAYNKVLEEISFSKKWIRFEDGTQESFGHLINTIPLPELIRKSDAPADIKRASDRLKCSQVLLVNIVVDHPATIPNHWIYVYDREMYATRINFTEMLSPENGEPGKCGIQVEVYFSAAKPRTEENAIIAEKVIAELITMQLIKSQEYVGSFHTKWINWANVIFDIHRKAAQEQVFNWLASVGMERESDDLEPMSDWMKKEQKQQILGSIILAGRFAQWKYFWTDDCVLRSTFIVNNIR